MNSDSREHYRIKTDEYEDDGLKENEEKSKFIETILRRNV